MNDHTTEERPATTPQDPFADKEWVRQEVARINALMGFVPDPDATPEKAQELMRAEGIRAEDNLFSRDIIRARYPEDFGEEDK